MQNLVTGDKLIIKNNDGSHNFEVGTEVEFLREHQERLFGYVVRGKDKDGTVIEQKILDEHL